MCEREREEEVPSFELRIGFLVEFPSVSRGKRIFLIKKSKKTLEKDVLMLRLEEVYVIKIFSIFIFAYTVLNLV